MNMYFKTKSIVGCMKRFIFWAFMVAILSAGEVGAISVCFGDTATFQGEIVVTAQRLAVSNFKNPGVTVVLDSNYLRQRPLRTVPESLMNTPGVFVQKTNHGGGSPFIRGLTGQQILMMVDGIRLNNATFRSGPNQYLNALDPAWTGRIETLLGSGSVEYGSDAIGGVIHILTHEPELLASGQTGAVWRPEATFQWATGGMETGAHAAINASAARWAIRAEGAYRNFGDLIGGKGIGVQSPTGYRQWSYAFKAVAQLNKGLHATFAWQDLEQPQVPLYHKVTLENFAFNNFDPQRRQLGYLRLSQKTDSKWWRKIELTASKQYMLEGRSSQKNNATVRVDETDKTNTWGLQFNVISDLARFWSMNTGVEWYADAVGSTRSDVQTATGASVSKRGLYPDQSRMQSWAAYNLHTLNWQRLTLSGGLRYNAFRIVVPDEVIGSSALTPSAWVGSVGISWEFVKNLRLYANWATAFRAPNVDDLGTLGIVDFRYEVPNYDLRPEKSRSMEAGIKWQHEKVQAGVSAYQLQLNDLIGRIRTGDTLQGYPVFVKENISQAFIRGLEAQFRCNIGQRWLAGAHATYTYGQNTSADEPLRRIPPLHGRVYAEFLPSEKVGFRAEVVGAGAQRRLASGDLSDNRIRPGGTPGWHIFNLSAWRQWKRFHLAAEWHNIFNEAYRIHGSGVDGTGHSLWLKAGVRW